MTIQPVENLTQNTQKGIGAGVPLGFEYFEDDSGRVKTLLAELRSAGVILSIEGDRLAYDAPAGAITDDRFCRMRADRDGLLALLRPEPVADAEAFFVLEWLSDKLELKQMRLETYFGVE